MLAHGQQQTQVAHNRHYQGVGGQGAVSFSANGEDTHDLVAIHQGAFSVNGHAAVGVAVVGHTHVRTHELDVVL